MFNNRLEELKDSEPTYQSLPPTPKSNVSRRESCLSCITRDSKAFFLKESLEGPHTPFKDLTDKFIEIIKSRERPPLSTEAIIRSVYLIILYIKFQLDLFQRLVYHIFRKKKIQYITKLDFYYTVLLICNSNQEQIDLFYDKIDWRNEGKIYWNQITEYLIDETSNSYDLKYLFGFHRLKPTGIVKPYTNSGPTQILYSTTLDQYIMLSRDDTVNIYGNDLSYRYSLSVHEKPLNPGFKNQPRATFESKLSLMQMGVKQPVVGIAYRSMFPQVFIAYKNRLIQQYDLSLHSMNCNIHPRGSLEIDYGTPTYLYSNIGEDNKKEYLVCGCHNGCIVLYDVETGDELTHYNVHKQNITQIQYIPALVGYLSSGLDNKMIIVDPYHFTPKTIMTDRIYI